ncbi:hypothetical protein RRG08_001422 [Elysia crispata]|uniref:Uncharacterized protein n=1 Tax=Elysia crispata TaxID=231223 RepID=A0AAE0ZQF4_9GAST|nr:hypothetical protein RRG08_001422 [Elysia crispata]
MHACGMGRDFCGPTYFGLEQSEMASSSLGRFGRTGETILFGDWSMTVSGYTGQRRFGRVSDGLEKGREEEEGDVGDG